MASIVRLALPRQPTIASTAARSAKAALPGFFAGSRSPVTARYQFTKNQTRVAAFHTTSKRDILPPLPQTVQGGVNDPAPVPPASPAHGSYHWTFERLLAASLVPMTVVPFAAGSLNPTMDAVLCGLILVHSHMGFQGIITDYLPEKRVPRTRKLASWGLSAATVLVGVGLYEFETNDVGVTEAIKRIWTA